MEQKHDEGGSGKEDIYVSETRKQEKRIS